MRGQPLWQVLLVILAFAAASVPVWRLTRPAASTQAASSSDSPPSSTQGNPSADAALTPLEIELAFAPMPEDFQLQHLGKAVLEGRGAQAKTSAHWSAEIPKEGIDLALQANWPTLPEGGAAAARVIVRLPNAGQVEKTFWQSHGGPMAEIVTVTKAAPDAAATK